MFAALILALQQTPDGFVPVTGAPVTEQIPAAPLVITAYGMIARGGVAPL